MNLKHILLCSGVALTSFVAEAQVKKAPAAQKASPASKTPVAKTSATPATSVKLTSLADSASYSLGVLVAQNFKSQDIAINPDLLAKAFGEVMNGSATLLSDMQANQILQKFMQAKQAEQFKPVKEASEKFLAENKKKEGVVTLPSGLQYQILKAGDGPKPTINDKVKTHYHGTLIDGTVFDSSVQRNEPITFPVSGVIQGWIEALQLMPVGSKWRLFVPQDLAYGPRGSGPTIKPYSALIFEVELLGIEK
ncbi:FKBP-type peptidyl-prolyl cis-trans isomerase [Flectobacillus major]|jgi:FKBP-type peptidyl-prolyl cis-trans isomerase FklB|uniref:FKBP-type peptidyl-prolyl cis-trans isomerase n=1 Tax=Flectobacillus major TaxID=103 RepID=UPI0003F92B09|nr:FKBP-type peptidyl-prolyl cis-trans isomerase [Flectobacillus major]